MQTHHAELVSRWFTGLNTGDVEGLVALFAEQAVICNAANPPAIGPGAPRALLEDFFLRTSARDFLVIDAASTDREIFAAWTATLLFRRGATVAGVTLGRDLEVSLRGAERFVLDAGGRIAELHIVHETTTVAQAARSAAAQTEQGGVR